MKSKAAPAAVLIALASAAVLTAPAFAQRNQNPEAYYKAPTTMHGKTVVIPTGTTFEGRMDNTIGSSISQPGERFTITMSAPVLANGTDVIIPAGAQILGEVVEAINHNKLPPRPKGAPKPTGKLRVQLTGLRTPDGMSYPMVCSLTGETIMMGQKVMANPGLGGGIGYMGSSASFEAVAPGMQDRYRRSGRGPQVMGAQQMMRDPIFGAQQQMNSMLRSGMVKPTIRALVRRNQELYIDEGAPLSVRLDAPFKIGINPTGEAGAALQGIQMGGENEFGAPAATDGSGRRFARSGSTMNPQQQQSVPFPRGQAAGQPAGQEMTYPGDDGGAGGGAQPFPRQQQAPPSQPPAQAPDSGQQPQAPGQDF